MKKINYLMFCLMATLVSMTFTSCEDEDTHEAMVLSGQWYGDFGMYYEVQDRYGNWQRFDSYDTDIVFYPDYDYATHGYGKQVDYYRYGPYDYQYYYFNWSIRNGVVYLTYPHDSNLNTGIYDYRMNNDYFEGRFEGSDTRFSLRKIVDYYDWSYYNGYGNYYYYPSNYYYDYYYDYPYYAKGRDGKAAPTGNEPAIRRGNRFTENK